MFVVVERVEMWKTKLPTAAGADCGSLGRSFTDLYTKREVLKSVGGLERPYTGSFPRFHSYPQQNVEITDILIHTNPQCGEREDGC